MTVRNLVSFSIHVQVWCSDSIESRQCLIPFRCRVLIVVNLVSLLAHVQVSCYSDSDESRQSLSTCSGVVLF